MMYLGNNPIGIATSLPIFGDKVSIEYNTYTPIEDTLVSTVTFNHNLGTIPDFIYIYTDPISHGEDNWEQDYLLQSNATNLVFINNNADNYYTFCMMRTKINTTSYASSYGGLEKANFVSATSFKVGIGVTMTDTLYFKANTTYHYILGKLKEVTPNA